MTMQTPIAYSQPAAVCRGPREAEYEVIAKITQQLLLANAKRESDFPGFVAALSRNERLWSTLVSDVVESGNGLPEALRAKLFYLYRFTADHSRKARAQLVGADVLIDINKAVMRGLRGEGG